MAKHVRYLSYVIRHKWFVLVAGRRVGAPLWRLLIHDWSKFLPGEWRPYAQFFYGPFSAARAQTPAEHAAFDAAWLKHQHRNPHHWQHWVLREDSGAVKPLPMPEHFVREMVADWMGAGRAITGKWEAAAWYEKNADKIQLHDDTRHRVEMLLGRHGNATCFCGARGSMERTCRRFGFCEAHLTTLPPIQGPRSREDAHG